MLQQCSKLFSILFLLLFTHTSIKAQDELIGFVTDPHFSVGVYWVLIGEKVVFGLGGKSNGNIFSKSAESDNYTTDKRTISGDEIYDAVYVSTGKIYTQRANFGVMLGLNEGPLIPYIEIGAGVNNQMVAFESFGSSGNLSYINYKGSPILKFENEIGFIAKISSNFRLSLGVALTNFERPSTEFGIFYSGLAFSEKSYNRFRLKK